MPVQTLIYSYLAICLSMIVFNCFCIVGFHHRDKRLTRRSSQFSHLLTAQLEQLASGQALPPDHQTLLQTKLRRVGNLQALDETLQALQQRSPEQLQPYLDAIAPVFSYLILDYRKKELLKPAYSGLFSGQVPPQRSSGFPDATGVFILAFAAKKPVLPGKRPAGAVRLGQPRRCNDGAEHPGPGARLLSL